MSSTGDGAGAAEGRKMKLVGGAALIGAILIAQQANAAEVVAGRCASLATGCLFAGNINTSTTGVNSFLLTQEAFNAFNDGQPSTGADLQLVGIGSSRAASFANWGKVTGMPGTRGTFALTDASVRYYAVVANNAFMLYELADGATSGTWNTDVLPYRKNPYKLDHLVFFGSAARPAAAAVGAVPEPATWAMMIAGFGAVGGALRRRSHRRYLGRAIA